ncbi:DUF6084 family protein [Jatrophihabitans telluris]|uniref:DUF6084 family protein n=1 Tax=Jatrophihabitans telluris TaxID=2038343 RepID=A0ABY4R0V3_9ACTN|nr:DUF6084 family protein [Jatrophihabitans telluris]UQX89479.1 DUF6084 family protein [Jatrophihabitans telluris]
MSTYTFDVLDIVAEPYAAAPQLTARLRITDSSGQRVHAMVLRCQVRIEPQRRRYDPGEHDKLSSLFGGHERWADTLKPFLWMQCNTTVQGFSSATDAELVLPCTYDFDVVAARYLHALGAGTVPLALLFSGTVFTRGDGGFGVAQVPWDCEARYDLPVSVWQQMMTSYFPNSGWIRLEQDLIDALAEFRARRGLLSWDETVASLLSVQREVLS